MDIFYSPEDQIDVFNSPAIQGTGNNHTDEFIANRLALTSNEDDKIRALAFAQANIKSIGPEQIHDQIKFDLDAKSFEMVENAVSVHADKLDIEGGREAVKNVQELNEGNESELERLARMAPAYLDQWPKNSIPREIARRQYAGWMMAAKMEQSGVTVETIGEKAKAFLGVMVPGRQTYQFMSSPLDLEQTIKSFHQYSD